MESTFLSSMLLNKLIRTSNIIIIENKWMIGIWTAELSHCAVFITELDLYKGIRPYLLFTLTSQWRPQRHRAKTIPRPSSSFNECKSCACFVCLRWDDEHVNGDNGQNNSVIFVIRTGALWYSSCLVRKRACIKANVGHFPVDMWPAAWFLGHRTFPLPYYGPGQVRYLTKTESEQTQKQTGNGWPNPKLQRAGVGMIVDVYR